MTDITPIIQAVITMIVAIATCVIIPPIREWFLTKTDEKTLSMVTTIIRTLVLSAEQTITTGTLKKEYVLEQAEKQFEKWGLTFDKEVVSDMIESEVYNLTSGEAKND